MKQYRLLVILLVIAALLMGCNKETDDANTTVSTEPAGYSSEESAINDGHPAFAVETVSAAKGDTDVVVCVSLKNNPGCLTIAMEIGYDSDSMSLTKVVSGSDYGDYYFVGPKNMQSGCTASWFLPKLPEKVVDGIILELHFAISEKAESGSYPVSITCPENGGIVDANKKEIIFNNAVGYLDIN